MKNKFLLLLPLLLFSFAFVSSADYITNCVELQNMNNALGNDYFLSNDIDCSDTINWNAGAGFVPIGSPYTTLFSGNLYGQGYTISNLYINRPTEDFVGLIGGMSNNIQDFQLTNAVIIGRNSTGEDCVGGIVGYCQYSTLSNLEFSGSVTGGNRVGGIVGTLNNCGLSDSISTGTVTGFDLVGGLVGISAGNIYSSNSSSDVYYYSSQYGGIYGGDDGNGRIYENNFFTGTLTQLPLAGDTTPPYFTSAPEGTSVGYNVPVSSSNFDAEDETAFDTFAVNDSEWTIDDDGTLQPPQGKAVGTYQVLITINDTSNNINTTTFTLTVTKNNQACSLEFRDGDGVFYNILSSPQEYGTSLYVWSGCDGGQFYVNGIPQSTGWFNNLEDGIYNFTVIRNSENYENYYSEVLFEILPQGIEAPQGVRKFWIFDKLEKPTITGEAISEGTSKFSLSAFFQNILNWFKNLFN